MRQYTPKYNENKITNHLSHVIDQINIEQFKQLSKKINQFDTDTS